MNDGNRRVSFPPFPPGYRASGVLLHVSSLPSPYGIGDIGPAALAWVDRLREAGQSWWQALPLGPTGYGNSPYQSLSSFAGNELLISPDGLIEDGLLRTSDCEGKSFSAASVDYDLVIPFKNRLLETAWNKFSAGARPDLRSDFDQFCHDQAHWLEDYALFRALKAKYKGAYYLEWPAELVRAYPGSPGAGPAGTSGPDRTGSVCAIPVVSSVETLKGTCPCQGCASDRRPAVFRLARFERRVGQPGVVPAGFDSTDRGSSPVCLRTTSAPRDSSGATPSMTGTRFVVPATAGASTACAPCWLMSTRSAWTISADSRLPGTYRPEHRRHNPANGCRVRAPSSSRRSQRELGGLPFIAEDLGLITPDVSALRDQFHVPGTRVLQFAFDGHSDNPHLPDNYAPNTVVYTGTHDNPTAREWYEELPDAQRRALWSYLKRPEGRSSDAAPALMQLAWSSAAALAIAPLQDVLNLGTEARMNVPGRAEGNWRWRCPEAMLSAPEIEWLQNLTKTSNRSGVFGDPDCRITQID